MGEPPPPIPDLPPPPAPVSLATQLPGLQGSFSVGEGRAAADAPAGNESEVPDFARQVQEWMAAKEAEEKASRSQEQAGSLSFANASASASSNSFKFDSDVSHDLPSMETKQGESSGWETMPRSQDWSSRGWDRQ